MLSNHYDSLRCGTCGNLHRVVYERYRLPVPIFYVLKVLVSKIMVSRSGKNNRIFPSRTGPGRKQHAEYLSSAKVLKIIRRDPGCLKIPRRPVPNQPESIFKFRDPCSQKIKYFF